MKPRHNISRTEYKLSSLILKSGTSVESANQNIKTDFLVSINITEYEVSVSYLMLMQEAYLTFYCHVRLHAASKLDSMPY